MSVLNNSLSKKGEIRHFTYTMSKNEENRQEAEELAKKIQKLKVSKDPRVSCKFCGRVSVKSQQSRHRKRDFKCKVIRAKLEVKEAHRVLKEKQARLKKLLSYDS